MVPYLLETDLGAETPEVLVSASPWIFLTAVLFSLATVYIACMRPCHIVAKVSPVEAVRMTEGSAGNRERKAIRSPRGSCPGKYEKNLEEICTGGVIPDPSHISSELYLYNTERV